MHVAPPPVSPLPAVRTGRAVLAGVVTALLLLLVVPRVAIAVPTLRHLIGVIDLGFAIASAALWLVKGRTSAPGAFGFGATLVCGVFVLLAALLFGFFVAAFH